ncbi:collagen alpha-1(I) chain-like [Symphalangus syndactylus]|uniref:collagen alpha-1(I) chain-like n=1 Tax=Symphalangus syndactylus TaxID=9590 RepID=UPI003007BAA6
MRGREGRELPRNRQALRPMGARNGLGPPMTAWWVEPAVRAGGAGRIPVAGGRAIRDGRGRGGRGGRRGTAGDCGSRPGRRGECGPRGPWVPSRDFESCTSARLPRNRWVPPEVAAPPTPCADVSGKGLRTPPAAPPSAVPPDPQDNGAGLGGGSRDWQQGPPAPGAGANPDRLKEPEGRAGCACGSCSNLDFPVKEKNAVRLRMERRTGVPIS